MIYSGLSISGTRPNLNEYFTSVRDVEKGIARRRRWIDVPKPEAMIKQPTEPEHG